MPRGRDNARTAELHIALGAVTLGLARTVGTDAADDGGQRGVGANADNGIDLAEELEALARRLQVDPLNDCCGVLRQMLRQGGSARSTLLTLKQLFEDRRLTTLQERIGKLSAKMSLVMMGLLFPALLSVLAGPGVIAITKALGGLG